MDQTVDYEYLNSCRLLSGLTNKAIAEACHTSEATISRFFRGEMKDPSALLLRAICDTIGASMDRALGLVKPIDTALTEPTPSIPAVVTDVMQTVSDIVDEGKLAEALAERLAKMPFVDAKELARLIVELMPRKDCDNCRSSRAYEATIAFQTKLITTLGGSLFGAVVLFVASLIVVLLNK